MKGVPQNGMVHAKYRDAHSPRGSGIRIGLCRVQYDQKQEIGQVLLRILFMLSHGRKMPQRTRIKR